MLASYMFLGRASEGERESVCERERERVSQRERKGVRE